MAIRKEPALLTVSEVAERLGVSGRTVRLWCTENGVLPNARQYGRAWLIPEGDLSRLIRKPVGRPRKERSKKSKSTR
jgi:excisionase family DNA binding protein